MTECTQDEWLEFLNKFHVYGSEQPPEVASDRTSLIHKHRVTKEELGKIRYHDNVNKTYYINKHCKTPQDFK